VESVDPPDESMLFTPSLLPLSKTIFKTNQSFRKVNW
jgi:hypothetical protein